MLSVSTSGKSRFQGKLDKIFWFIIMILPLVFWLVLNMVPVFVSAETENTEESATVSTVAEDYTYRLYFNYIGVFQSIPDLESGLSSGWRFVLSSYSSSPFDVMCLKDDSSIDSFDLNVLYLRLVSSENNVFRYSVVHGNATVIDLPYDFIDSLALDFGLNDFVYYRFSNSFFLNSNGVRLHPESSFESVIERVPVEKELDFLSLEGVLVNYFGIDMISENSGGIIGDTLYGVFGSTGIFPIFTRDSAMIYYMIYFVYVEILHVLIDILVFIPRFAHKILGKAINFGD